MRFLQTVALVLCAAALSAASSQPSPDEVFHQAVRMWIASDSEGASILLHRNIRTPRIAPTRPQRQENARLTNLLAWIEYEREMPDPGASARQAKATALQTAETLAARAMYEAPLDLTYWYDYASIAAERHGAEAFDRFVEENGRTTYPGVLVKNEALVVPNEDGDRAALRAILAEQRGDVHEAAAILERFVETKAPSCIARITMANLQLSFDRIATAEQLLDSLPRECIPGPTVIRMRARIASLHTDTKQRAATWSQWRQAEPASWQRLELAHQRAGRREPERTDAMVALRNHRFELEATILRNPRNLDAWRRLFAVVVTDKKRADYNRAEYNALLRRIRQSNFVANAAEVQIASAYPLIYDGKFEKALEILAPVAKNEPYRAETLAAVAILDAAINGAEGIGKAYMTRLAALDQQTAAKLDPIAMQVCYQDRDECNLAALFTTDDLVDVLRWLDHGCSERPGAVYDLKRIVRKGQREIRRDVKAMLQENENRMLAAMRLESQRRRTVERFLRGELAVLRKEQKAAARDRAVLRERLLGVERRARELERQQVTLRNEIRTVKTEIGTTNTEVSRLITRIAFDEDMLKRFESRFDQRFVQQNLDFRNMINAIVRSVDEAAAKLAETEDQLISAAARKGVSDLVKAVAVLRHLGNATPRQIWEALVLILDRSVNLVYSPLAGVEIDIVGSVDLMVDLLLGDEPLPAL